MTEKIVITRRQDKIIQGYIRRGIWDKGRILNYHIEDVWGGLEEVLKSLTVPEMARVLYEPNSYEVEFIENLAIGEIVKYIDIETEGNIYGVVTRIEKNEASEERDQIFACWDGKDFEGYMRRDRVFKCTDEEIRMVKERQLWKSIGRECGEVKNGDIGIGRSGFRYGDIDEIKDLYKRGNLFGFYPAESFISFEEGEGE